MTHTHHLFVSLPATSGLSAQVARALALGRADLAAAGYGPAVLGPVPAGGLHVDETIAGRAAAGLSGLYAQARSRAEAFGAKLGGPVGRLVVPALPYDSYFPALWRHQAARRAMPAFGELAPQLVALSRGWVDLVADLIAALNPAETVVLPAPVQASDVLDALVPEVRLSAEASTGPQVPDTALAMLQRLYRSGVCVAPKQASRLIAFHQRQPQPAPLAAFSPFEVAQLRRRYRADLARIERLPGVRIGAGVGLAFAAE